MPRRKPNEPPTPPQPPSASDWIKKLWLPVSGFIAAVTAVVKFLDESRKHPQETTIVAVVLISLAIIVALLYVVKNSRGPKVKLQRFSALCGLLVVTLGAGKVLFGLVAPVIRQPIIVGAQNWTEQEILAHLLKKKLKDKGEKVLVNAHLNFNDASTIFKKGNIDCYVEYTGAAYTNDFGKPPKSDTKAVFEEIRELYKTQGIEVSEPLGLEDDWALLVSRPDSQKWKLSKISDLKNPIFSVKIGFTSEFGQDACGVGSKYDFSKAYNLSFAGRHKGLSSQLYDRLKNQALHPEQSADKKPVVLVVVGNSTDAEINDNDFVQLVDDKRAFPPYEAIVVASKEARRRSKPLDAVMKEIGGTVSTENIVSKIRLVTHKEKTAEQAGDDLAKRTASNSDKTSKR